MTSFESKNSGQPFSEPPGPEFAHVLIQAAHMQLMLALAHKLMNQQNGVQINGRLISTLIEQIPGDYTELASASDRLIAGSRRSVRMFSAVRALGNAIVDSPGEADRTVLVVQSTLPPVIESVCEYRAAGFRLHCDDELMLPGTCISALAALIMRLLNSVLSEVELNIGKFCSAGGKNSELLWRISEPELLGQAQRLLDSAAPDNPVLGALPVWLVARGNCWSVDWHSQSCQIRMDLPLQAFGANSLC